MRAAAVAGEGGPGPEPSWAPGQAVIVVHSQCWGRVWGWGLV